MGYDVICDEGQWIVIDDDGNDVRKFSNEEEAWNWLDGQSDDVEP